MIQRLRENKKAEWKQKGYPDILIEQGLALADNWVSRMANAFSPPDPQIKKSIILSSYPKAFECAENWIKVMMK